MNETVDKVMEELNNDNLFRRGQLKSAAEVVSQFLWIRQGLRNHVPTEEVDVIAAHLTAAVFGRLE
jgi:hypothetical protein